MKYFIKTPLLLFLFFLSSNLFAQSNDCEQLKTEIDYLKKVLKIQSEPQFKDIIQGLEVKILNIEGSTRAQTIMIEGLFTTTKPSIEKIQPSNFSAIDMEGNNYPASNGPGDYAIYLDVPQKILFQIEKINPNITNLRLLKFTIQFYDNGNGWKSQEMTYKNVKINWK